MTENEKTLVLWTKEKREELEQYRAIGTVEECRTAVERMKPKKPIERMRLDGSTKAGKCPMCQLWVNNSSHWSYCECGQRIDWSE